jgi:BlaI family transcriptional regulator, penicillinase repressor
MSRDVPDVTDAEFAVLEALWDGGPQTIRELTGRLYPSLSVSDYATVQKLLARLEEKRCVGRDRSGHRHVFQATRQRDALVGAQLRKMAEKLCAGSLAPVLLQLVQGAKLSPSERDELRKLLDEADRTKSSTSRRKS